MQKAVNQWCFPSDWSWERVFGLREETGLQGIELCIDYPPFFGGDAERSGGGLDRPDREERTSFAASKALRVDRNKAEVRAVAALAADHGIAVASALTISQFHYSLVDPDPTIRRTGIDLVRRLLDIAAIVEVKSHDVV